MSEEDLKKLKHMLTAEMVSRVSLAEAVNIMHNLAVNEVETNVDNMSDEEKQSALEELQARVKKAAEEKTEAESAE
jgi:Mg/Co/Ni transporter MgtE|tara:strand:- start:1366 stop:1593 length:228 start_codon:yes stop_codon:yes gene_type:complete